MKAPRARDQVMPVAELVVGAPAVADAHDARARAVLRAADEVQVELVDGAFDAQVGNVLR